MITHEHSREYDLRHSYCTHGVDAHDFQSHLVGLFGKRHEVVDGDADAVDEDADVNVGE